MAKDLAGSQRESAIARESNKCLREPCRVAQSPLGKGFEKGLRRQHEESIAVYDHASGLFVGKLPI